MDNSELAKHWIELQKLPRNTPEAETLMWVAFVVIDMSDNNPDKCFDFIVEVLKQTDDEWVLANLAAGPLESMLVKHPEEGLALIEKEIVRLPELKYILQGVWQNLMAEETWQHLQNLRD
jgi:hypothetical protein